MNQSLAVFLYFLNYGMYQMTDYLRKYNVRDGWQNIFKVWRYVSITPQNGLMKAIKSVCKVLPLCVLLGCCLGYHS